MKPNNSAPIILDNNEGLPDTIQGQPAGSIQESRVAQALYELRLPFEYQVPIMGGRDRAGGQVVDFLVDKAPRPVPLYVQGAYWHGTLRDPEKNLKLALLEHYMKGTWDTPVELWDFELTDMESTRQVILRKVGIL